MARIRSIKPEFWTSDQVVECSPNARLLFIGLWNFCDDGGVHPASPRRLKMEVFPGDPFDTEQISALVDELKNAGLLQEYEVEGKAYWIVSGWRHQKIDQPTFKHPKPDGAVPSTPGRRRTQDERSSDVRRTIDERSPPEGMGCREETKNTCGSGDPPGRNRPRDEIWDAVISACGLDDSNPTKSERGAWNKVVSELKGIGASPDEIRARASAYRKTWPEVSLTPSALVRRWGECVSRAKRQAENTVEEFD